MDVHHLHPAALEQPPQPQQRPRRRPGLAPDRPELDNAQKILAEQAARRDALFEQSFENEKNKGDALSKRFEEALREAKKEPVTKPLRGFDLD